MPDLLRMTMRAVHKLRPIASETDCRLCSRNLDRSCSSSWFGTGVIIFPGRLAKAGILLVCLWALSPGLAMADDFALSSIPDLPELTTPSYFLPELPPDPPTDSPVTLNGVEYERSPLDAANETSSSTYFTPFSHMDWLFVGALALVNLGDFSSSNALSYQSRLTNAQCSSNLFCKNAPVRGEGNPLITGIYGTDNPRTWQYASFFAAETALQVLTAWALPQDWRIGSLAFFIGIGAADTVMNGYGGGLTFRF